MFNANTRSYYSPFTEGKENEEQEAFEHLLRQEEGTLNLYNYDTLKPNFWGDFNIRIPKEGLRLDLGTPNGALTYRILSVDPKVAMDNESSKHPAKVFRIFDEEKEKQTVSTLAKKKSKAYKYIAEATKTKKSLIETLRLLDKKPDPKSTKDWLEGELYKITDQVETIKGVAGIDRFIQVMEDSARDTKLFVLDAIDQHEIIRDANGYKIADVNKFLGRDYKEVVQYFLNKDPKVQEEKLIIQDRIK